MIGTSVYIIGCTMRNRARARLRRLRQPRYLLGAIVGAAYLYFTIFARRAQGRRRSPGREAASAAAMAAIIGGAPPVIAAGLLGLAALAWIVPVDTGLVTFSDAEVDFLFPAPVTRQQLVLHRLARSQLALLIGSVVALIAYRGISSATRIRTSLALWLVLITLRVYATGVMQARRGFSAAAPRLKRLAWTPALVIAAAAAVVAFALARAFVAHPANTLTDAMRLTHDVVTSGVPAVILAPLTALVRPMFDASWPAYLVDAAAALLVAAFVTAWLVRTDQAFFEDGIDGAAASAERRTTRAVPPRAVPWSLAPSGRPELALAWRAAVGMIRSTGSIASLRPIVALAFVAVGLVIASRQRGLAQIVMMFASVGAFGSVVLGPQMLRIDLRQDLRNIDVLKTWPIRPADLIRGEIVWPMTVLSVIGWAAIALALATSGSAFGAYPWLLRGSMAAAAVILTPLLIAGQLTIHNAAALAFPAWIPTGNQRPRGLDAMGQRLILLGATMLLLAIMVIPGAAAGAGVWFAFKGLLGPAVLVPASVVCAVILFVELLVATEAMGPLYDQVDLSEIERAET